MDFYTVLDQVVDLLRSRGRVSYRALKRQLALDVMEMTFWLPETARTLAAAEGR